MVRLNSIKGSGKKRFFPVANKYGAIRTRCTQGHNHPSKGEAKHCETLHLLFRAEGSTIEKIEYEKAYILEVRGVKISIHKPDWTLTYKSGEKEIIEFKGKPTPEWKLKHKLFMALYPDIKYTVVGAR